jgi:hypothetical protein
MHWSGSWPTTAAPIRASDGARLLGRLFRPAARAPTPRPSASARWRRSARSWSAEANDPPPRRSSESGASWVVVPRETPLSRSTRELPAANVGADVIAAMSPSPPAADHRRPGRVVGRVLDSDRRRRRCTSAGRVAGVRQTPAPIRARHVDRTPPSYDRMNASMSMGATLLVAAGRVPGRAAGRCRSDARCGTATLRSSCAPGAVRPRVGPRTSPQMPGDARARAASSSGCRETPWRSRSQTASSLPPRVGSWRATIRPPPRIAEMGAVRPAAASHALR